MINGGIGPSDPWNNVQFMKGIKIIKEILRRMINGLLMNEN